MRRRWKILLLALGITALLIGGWFGWGAWQSARFEERLAAMYADGSLKTFAQLQGEPVPDAENGWALLKEADALRDEVEDRIRDELLDQGPISNFVLPADRREWTPEQVAHERRVLRELAPMFAKLDEALERPRIAYLGTPPLESSTWVPVNFACRDWLRRMRMEPRRYPEDADRMIRLFERWKVRDGADAGIRTALWRHLVLTALHEGLEGGHIASAKQGWQDSLGRGEAPALARTELEYAWARATTVWLTQAWRRGEDPLADVRSTFAKLPIDLLAGMEGDESDARNLVAWVRKGRIAGRPPWYSAWYGRPWMHEAANVVLDLLQTEPPRPFTVERFRADMLGDDATAAHEARNVMHTITALRLARVALAVRGAIAKGDTGPPFDLRVGVAARLGGQHLTDPLSGKLFVLDAKEKHVVVTVRPSKALDALDERYAKLAGDARDAQLHEDLLLWRVPVP